MESAGFDSSADADNEMTMYKKQEMSFMQGRRKKKVAKKNKEDCLSAGELDENESDENFDPDEKMTKHFKIHDSNEFLDKQADKLYEKMKFYLDCDFNLFVYGVGTKKNFLNSFVLS